VRKLFIYIIACFCCLFSFGQDYNYVHYDTKDGLAGSTVYDIGQDKDGYLWFATEFGLSRFDGKTFKNFTTDNRLTDNEILRICPDSKGKIWIIPYNKSLCFYYKGKITNADSLYKIDIKTKIYFFGSCDNGNFFIVCNGKIYLLKFNGKKEVIADLNEIAKNNKISRKSIENIEIAYNFVNGKLRYNILLDNIIISIKDSGIVALEKINPNTFIRVFNNSIKYGINKKNEFFVSTNYKGIIISTIPTSNPNVYLVSTLTGSYFMDSTGNLDLIHPLLKGERITRSFTDNENNIWFTTLGNGVFKLSSTGIKTYYKKSEVFSILKYQNNTFIGASNANLYCINQNGYNRVWDFQNFNKEGFDKRLYCMKNDKGNLFLGFDCFLLKKTNEQIFYSPIRPIKSIDIIDSTNIVVATNGYVFKVNRSTLKITDTILHERGTKVICDGKNIYVGTLKGLVEINEFKKINTISDNIPILQRRITDLVKMNDGSLWIATNDTGILHFSKGKIDAHITTSNKLSSNLCRTLFIDKNFLWVGTNKGINKIDISKNNYPILKYSESDGLPSNVINTIYVEDSTVYIGTPGGLTYFNENNISQSSICNLVMESVTVSDNPIDSINNIHLSYKNNNISFNYTAISFKSGGEFTYNYKLSPLDKIWKETKLNTLSYLSLPPGNYQLQLYAINKFGKRSSIIIISFEIETPFWKTIWFWLLLFFITLLLLGILIRRRFIKIQEVNNEKARIQQQLATLEQSALQAQMNPHFIFNCLNSIQQFIMLDDKRKANKYLTEFATLIRNTFDNSGKKNITVSEEANYLDKYLDLEQLRYGDDFSYKIIIDNSVEKDYTQLPAMLLQPYVENSLRHGIRNKKEGHGEVLISFIQTENTLICSVKDNGVGREAATGFKSREHIEYQSKGMKLTERRIQLLNTGLKYKITVEVLDLKDYLGNATGTEVIVEIPLQ